MSRSDRLQSTVLHMQYVCCSMFALLIYFILYITAVQACGPVTHSVVAHRALYHTTVNEKLTPHTIDLLNKYSAYVTSGSVFPDYLYHCTFDHDTGEVAHWIPFQATAIEYMKTLPNNTIQYDQLAAFMYGVVSHSVSDINWHGISWMVDDLPGGYGFLETLGQADTNCIQSLCTVAHQLGDFGGDLVAAQNTNISWFDVSKWEIPTHDLINIFARMNHTVSYNALRVCRDVFIGATKSFIGLGLNPETYHKLTDYGSTLVEHYIDLHVGGIDDMAVYTTRSWQRYEQWLLSPTATIPTPLPIGSATEQTFDIHDTVQIDSIYDYSLLQLNVKSSDYYDDWHSVANMPAIDHKTYRTNQPKGNSILRHSTVQPATELPPYSYYGHTILTGDVNNDGQLDYVYTACGAGSLHTGEVHIHYSDDTVQILYGTETYSKFGYAVAIVDYNVDGYNDLVVSAPTTGYNTTDLGNTTYAYYGAVYIYYGNKNAQVNNEPDIILHSARNISMQFFGDVLHTADINGDGHNDLLIGSPYGRTDEHMTTNGYIDIYYASTNNTYTEYNTPDLHLHGWDNFWLYGSSMQVLQYDEYTRLVLVSAPGYRYYYTGLKTNGLVEAFNISGITDAYVIEDYKSVFAIIQDDTAQFHSQFGFSISYSNTLKVLAVASPAANYIDQRHSLYELLYHSLIALINLFVDITLEENTKHMHSGTVHLIDISNLHGDYRLSELPNKLTTIQHTQRGSRFGSTVEFVSTSNHQEADTRLVVTAPLYSMDNEHTPQIGAVYIYDNVDTYSGIVDAQSTAKHTILGSTVNGRFGRAVQYTHNHGIDTLLVGEPRADTTCKTDNCNNEMIGIVRTFEIPS